MHPIEKDYVIGLAKHLCAKHPTKMSRRSQPLMNSPKKQKRLPIPHRQALQNL